MIDPLHQFMIHPLVHFEVGGYDLSFTNSALFMLLATVLPILFLGAASRNSQLVPGRLQYIGESIFSFVQNLIRENVGEKGLSYTPYILSIFMFVLMGNCLGMIPYGFTFTSHIVVTFAMAMIVFIGVTIIGLVKHGVHFFRLFFPEGTPLYIAPLLIPVEIMSYFTRPVSLSVRLFANMVAGHVMLKIFAGFVILLAGTSLFPLAILPFVINFAVIAFEFLVALLQAYVFTVLTCIYLNDAINLH
ncbi:F0F1 ATP synthase subunit A [Candidatus Paracaedibacter symbiosus]|uniref:F0F1 ATP synthase subunit A n=1 Tax=Candidatus Paracaedibacter symbiosus TaxID=244582 RepID=UPI000509FA11|nr:F0F1 ATP synthase subunit A [Candidatus Paracaedibacter symbiosus]